MIPALKRQKQKDCGVQASMELYHETVDKNGASSSSRHCGRETHAPSDLLYKAVNDIREVLPSVSRNFPKAPPFNIVT